MQYLLTNPIENTTDISRTSKNPIDILRMLRIQLNNHYLKLAKSSYQLFQ